MLKRYLSFIVYHLSFFIAFTQQTQIFIDKEGAYKNGIELFDEKNYLSARQKFEEIYKQPKTSTSHVDEVLMQNLEYYIAVCATEADDKDAEQLLLKYVSKYHETDKRRLIYFYLGKYYYHHNQYTDAITWFNKVDINDLNNSQIYDYMFQLAYSYFTKKKFAEAKPRFASIKDIKEKYYYPANYYYAFICFYTKDYDEALKSFKQIEDSKMYAAVIPYYIAQIYFFKGERDKVIGYVKTNLDHSDVLYKTELKFLLGQVYFQKGEYARALPLLEEFISKSSKYRKEDIYQLAYCQYKTGGYEKAIENFKELSSVNDKMGQNAVYALADCYLQTKQKEKARSAFQNAASMNFDDDIKQHSVFNYGKISFELGFANEAIQSFESYLSKYPSGSHVEEANELLAAALVKTKNYERAYKILEGLSSESALLKETYQKVTYFRAIELYNDKKYDEALALCQKSLTNVMNIELQALALYLKAEILFEKEQYEDAALNYSRFVEYTSPALEKKGQASKFRANYNIGYCYFKKKNYPDATLYFENALSDVSRTVDIKGKNTLLPDLYLRYADCQFVQRNYNKALPSYEKIVAMKWSAAEYAQFQKAIVLGLMNKDDEKIEALNYLILNYPASNYADQANFELGETYLQMSNYESARTAYQKVINRNPNSVLISKCYMKLAAIDYSSGKKEQAIESYKQVILKFPKSAEASESVDALRDIYVELGRTKEFFDFTQKNTDVIISSLAQDTLMFTSAEMAYEMEDCPRTIKLFSEYLERFPAGLFANEAHWYISDCYVKDKNFKDAFPNYEAIIKNKNSKYYERAVLKASGIAYYEFADYEKASELYKLLYVNSTSAQNTYTAMAGLLRTSIKVNNTTQTIEYADQFINSGMAKEADLQEALFEKAKALYAQGNKEFALGAFNHVTEMPVSERAVEAKYMTAKILFEQHNYKPSMDTCFKLKNKYPSYEFWVAKAFVLIADDYNALGNTFQAKATLESIIQYYEGDKAIIDEAKSKLEEIKADEINKSKLMQPAPADTLIMETDSLINH